MLLEEQGCAVTAVGDGQAAVDSIRSADFELAVLDVTMPRLDGLSAAALLKQARPGLPIVLHTAMDEDWVRRRFTGYEAFFEKPLNVDRFFGRLAVLLS